MAKSKAKLVLGDVALFGVLGALTFGAKVAMSWLPNIEPVSLFVMLFAVVFGMKCLYPIYLYVTLEILVYGRLPLMLMENCVIRNRTGNCSCDTPTRLIDRMGEEFPILKDGGTCRNVLFNGKKLYLLDKLSALRGMGLWAHRLNFTTENPSEVDAILSQYQGRAQERPHAGSPAHGEYHAEQQGREESQVAGLHSCAAFKKVQLDDAHKVQAKEDDNEAGNDIHHGLIFTEEAAQSACQSAHSRKNNGKAQDKSQSIGQGLSAVLLSACKIGNVHRQHRQPVLSAESARHLHGRFLFVPNDRRLHTAHQFPAASADLLPR